MMPIYDTIRKIAMTPDLEAQGVAPWMLDAAYEILCNVRDYSEQYNSFDCTADVAINMAVIQRRATIPTTAA